MTTHKPIQTNDGKDYTDYELSLELEGYDDSEAESIANEHSFRLKFTYDHETSSAYGMLIYETNGFHNELAPFKLDNYQFYRITGHPISPQDKLSRLREVTGQVTINDGIATFEDGTTLAL